MSPKAMPSFSDKLARRAVLRTGGRLLAGFAAARLAPRADASEVVTIRMRSVDGGAHVRFDPIGVLVRPGATIRWVIDSDVHTATAYHPDNDRHALRIPEAAAPWDSGYLVDPGDAFETTLTVEGVYDYFCAPHELAGMVGRIVVGAPGGPGALPFDYFKGDPDKAAWKSVPPAARAAFPSVERILRRGPL